MWDIIFSTIIGLIFGSGGVWTFGKDALKRRVDHHFNEKLEDHKFNLQTLSEKSAFDYQRMIYDFTLYSSEKHSVYANVYKEILTLRDLIKGLRGFIKFPSFTEYNVNDIIDYMQRIDMTEGKIKEISDDWENNQQSSREKLNQYLLTLEQGKAEQHLYYCRKIFYENELFMSDEVAKNINEFIDKLSKLLKNYLIPYDGSHEENQTLRKEIGDIEEKVKKSIQRELSAGDYSKY